MIKYLYGKSLHLTPFINGATGLRFSDLSHYSRIENAAMRDDELNKKFSAKPDRVEIRVNNQPPFLISNVVDFEVTIPPVNCYCLCLSGRKNCQELYKRFKADVCLAIDIDRLIEVLRTLEERFPGMQIEHDEIKYYDPCRSEPVFDRRDVVFYKPHRFRPEAEYRVVLRIPENRRAFKSQNGIVVPCFLDGESMHLTIAHEDSKINNYYLVAVYRPALRDTTE